MNLTPAQRAAAAHQGGWPLALIPIAVAVSMAENTSGDPAELGDVGLETAEWGPSVGLWQIRSRNAERGTGGTRDELANRDPVVNARHAYTIYRQQGWAAWSVFNTGKYRAYLTDAMRAAAAPDLAAIGALSGAASAAGSAVDGIGSALDAARTSVGLATAGAKWITNRHNIVRVGLGVVGVGLVVAAAARLGAPAAGAVTKATAPIGKAAALAAA